ncbi:glycosyltransferase family 2 protein [Microbacterium sp. W4I4]|uniref:glycosyltransferase family 2 protein n=1 Tax=Microbacterium sp. W4I4 TaxID=3042295 RepID=UPI0027D7AB72|nr:glycosyltransferase family 2 protein [Microbacterium sp. W4I4]
MKDELRVLIVIPALNEEASVHDVVDDVRRTNPTAEVLVVSDGSTDRTVERARAAGATTLALPYNLGVGGAMRAGFRYAESNGFDVVVQVDADGQHDPAFVPRMLDRLAECDLVIGARFAGVGDYSVSGPRRWAMKTFASVISHLSGVHLTDVTSGFKVAGPRAVRLFAHTFPAEYLGDTLEALVIAARAGLRLGQEPVEMRVRQAGEPSHNPMKAAVYLFRAGMAMLLALLRPRNEMFTGGQG